MVTADWGNGMDINEVSESLQFGSRHTDEGPLCIHGVGLNNFLLVATRNKYPWFIATKKPEEDSYHLVDGPFVNSLIQSMPDDKMKAALKVAKGDVAKLPHYNLEIVVDKNLPR